MAFHGVEVQFQSISPPSVRTVDASTIFCVGTAPAAPVDGEFGDGTAIRYNHPFLLTKRSDAPVADLGADGTLTTALDGIFAQGNFKVAMVIVEEGTARTMKVAYDMDVENFMDTLSGKSWTVSGDQVTMMGLIAADVTALNNDVRAGDQITVAASGGAVLETWTVTTVTASGTTATITLQAASTVTFTDATAYDLQIVAVPAQTAVDVTRVNATGVASELTGIHAANAVESVHGVIPRLLCAAGLDTGSRPGGAGNGLAAAMVVVADQLRAMAIIDGPNTNHADVITYIGDFDSDRAIVVDPAVLVANDSGGTDERALSAYATGVIARTDYEIGWWASPSNKTINGIVGLARPIDSGHRNSRAQLMLDNAIWTVANDAGGFQLWGTDTPATTDPEYSFPNVRRTADIMADSLIKAHRWAVARGITKNYLSAVSEAVNGFISRLVAQGALSGGLCYPDDALNTRANIALGQVYFNIEWTPVYPANNVTFRMQLTTKYLEALAA